MRRIAFLILIPLLIIGCSNGPRTLDINLTDNIKKYHLVENIYSTKDGYNLEISNIEKGNLYATYHTLSTLKMLDENLVNKNKPKLTNFLELSIQELNIKDRQLNDKLFYTVSLFQLLKLEVSKSDKDKILDLLNQLINDKGQVFSEYQSDYTDIGLIYQAIHIFDYFNEVVPVEIINNLKYNFTPVELYEHLALYKIYSILNFDTKDILNSLNDLANSKVISSNPDMIELNLYFDLYQLTNLELKAKQIVQTLSKYKNEDGGWGLVPNTDSDILSTHFAVYMLSSMNNTSNTNDTIKLLNKPTTTGGFTYILPEETSIISNFYFSSINKILNQKNENNKNILYYTKDRLNDDLEQNSPFELYMLAQTLENETSNNDVLDEFSADVRNYIEKNNTSSPIQIFYLSKLNKLFSSKQEKKIANLLEKQVPLLLEEDSSEEFKETIRLFSDIIENNLIKTSQKINLKDYDIKKILQYLENDEDLQYILFSEVKWDNSKLQKSFLSKKIDNYELELEESFSSQTFYKYLLILEQVNGS